MSIQTQNKKYQKFFIHSPHPPLTSDTLNGKPYPLKPTCPPTNCPSYIPPSSLPSYLLSPSYLPTYYFPTYLPTSLLFTHLLFKELSWHLQSILVVFLIMSPSMLFNKNVSKFLCKSCDYWLNLQNRVSLPDQLDSNGTVVGNSHLHPKKG